MAALALVLAPVPAHADEAGVFSMGETALVGTFYTNASKYTFIASGTYYEVTKDVGIMVPVAPTVRVAIGVALERENYGDWISVDSANVWLSPSGGPSGALSAKIRQNTAATTQYRFHIWPVPDLGMAETISPVFTVTGEMQNPGVSVEYSKKSQRYKKDPVQIKITTERAFEGKAVIYDGKKKLKSLIVKNGSASVYSLSKKLKVGTHKISVEFTPRGNYKPFYSVVKTKVRNIKVKG
jgi:hypothetical protein